MNDHTKKPFDNTHKFTDRKPDGVSSHFAPAKPRPAGKPFDRTANPRPVGKPFDGAARPRPDGKPFDRAARPHAEGKPFDGTSRPRPAGKPFDGAPRPRPEGKPFNGATRPRPVGKPFDGATRPRPVGKPFDGASRPRPEGKPFDGTSSPRPEGKSFDGAARSRPEGKPFDGASRPRPAGKPFDGASRPRPSAPREFRKSARDAALFALQDVVRGGAYAAQALDRQLTQSQLSPEDKRLTASLFYTAAENRLYFEYVLSKFTREKPDPLVWDIMNIAAAQLLRMDRIPDHAAVNEAVEQTRTWKRGEYAGLVNGVLHSLIAARDSGESLLPERDDLVQYLSTVWSYSPAVVKRLIASYGAEEAEAILSFVPPDRGTTVIRPNLMRTTLPEFESYLNDKGISWTHGIVPGAYRCRGLAGLATLDGYTGGYFSIQGESSLLTAMACEAKPGMQMLDTCAAPGGKSGYLCEAMRGTGRVYAWDVYPHRADLIKSMGARLKLDNLRVMTRDARAPYPDFDDRMDVVLIDAPCSGLGVVSEKPDIKYRTTDLEMDDLVTLQRDILDACCAYVCPGGRLVYSTCTILPEENEKQIRAFLTRHPDFEPDEDVSFLPEPLRGHAEQGMTQLLRHRDGVEGFFIARLRKRSL